MNQWCTILGFVLGVWVTAYGGTAAGACEFCIREVGFVPLFDEPYRLVVTVDPAIGAATRTRWREEIAEAVGPANVVVEIAESEEATGRPNVTVFDSDGRSRSVATEGASIAETVRALVHSPARAGLARSLLDGYATVLLIEGAEADGNAAARETVEAAIRRINAAKSGFDRQIASGPAIRVITPSEAEAERWLLWSLGIDEHPPTEPRVAVLFGRGRRMGELLASETLTEPRLYQMLAYVARDCECTLDKDWLYGRAIPLAWDDTLRERARTSLGFDPESAATRAEVARILQRGGRTGIAAADPFAEPIGTPTGIPGLTIYDLDDPSEPDTESPPKVEPPRVEAAAAASDEAAGPRWNLRWLAVSLIALVAGAILLVGGRGRPA